MRFGISDLLYWQLGSGKMGQKILEAREITLRFGGLEALNGLSFSVDPCQIVSIIGPNGAGKTTLLNTIT